MPACRATSPKVFLLVCVGVYGTFAVDSIPETISEETGIPGKQTNKQKNKPRPLYFPELPCFLSLCPNTLLFRDAHSWSSPLLMHSAHLLAGAGGGLLHGLTTPSVSFFSPPTRRVCNQYIISSGNIFTFG